MRELKQTKVKSPSPQVEEPERRGSIGLNYLYFCSLRRGTDIENVHEYEYRKYIDYRK